MLYYIQPTERRVDSPGAAHLLLVENVLPLDPEPRIFEAMLEGWARKPSLRQSGVAHVRWGKSSRGGPPKRRTVSLDDEAVVYVADAGGTARISFQAVQSRALSSPRRVRELAEEAGRSCRA